MAPIWPLTDLDRYIGRFVDVACLYSVTALVPLSRFLIVGFV
jgi:hypothetical protein